MKFHLAISSPIVLLLATTAAPSVRGRIGRATNHKISTSTPPEGGARSMLEVCDADIKDCPGGIFLSRDPAINCEFQPCPRMDCQLDVKECDDGSTVSRDPDNNCEFPECPVAPILCTDDVKECDDGSYVSRYPDNNCEFEECPLSPFMCAMDAKRCMDGSYVSRDPQNNCEFEDCPVLIFCIADAKECPDGSYMSRDPFNDCQFKECPRTDCPLDVKDCDDGSRVGRDPTNGCEFPKCPEESITIEYPVCTEVAEASEDVSCRSCCHKTFQSYRSECADDRDCHDLNTPTFLKCEDQCVLSCQTQCIQQDETCVEACGSSQDKNSCLRKCNDHWWTCSGTCRQERLDNREHLNDSKDLTPIISTSGGMPTIKRLPLLEEQP